VPVVELHDVAVRRGRRTVLGPLTWRVEAGEHWAVLGPNGAGKTTLLSVTAATLHPFTGRAVILGGELGRVDVRRLRTRIGHVGHALAERLHGGMSTLDTVLTGITGALAPWWDTFDDTQRAAALERLRRVGCETLADQAFEQCSQGERQRVLVARVLMAGPELVLLDEPAAGLDLPGREVLLHSLEDAADELGRVPTVLVTHHVEELPRTTTHALLLRDGLAVAAGPVTETLRDEPMSACFGIPVRVTHAGGRFSARAG